MKYDAIFISYPKSGRTWIRFMLLKLYSLCRNEKEIKKTDLITEGLPSIYFTHANAAYGNLPTIEELLKKYGNSKLVFLMRDPRDIMTAMYHQPMFDYIDDKYFDIRTRKPYSIDVWIKSGIFERYLDWLYRCEKALCDLDVNIILYENFLRDSYEELFWLLQFLKIDVSYKLIEETIEFASFGNMKKMQNEGKTKIAKTWLVPKKYQVYFTKDSYIDFITGARVRKGIAGDYKNHLSEDSINYCNNMMKNSGCGWVRYYEA